MIVMTGTVTVKDGDQDEMRSAVEAMVAATREEDGCDACRYAVSLDDPLTFTFHEEWSSMDAAKAHGGTPHMAEFGQRMMPLLTGPPEATMWSAERVPMG